MASVESNQVAVRLNDGVTVSSVVGPGRYGNGSWYADIQIIDVSIKTETWNDPSLVTADNQPIGLTLTISYKRMSDSENVTKMFNMYRSEATNDESFKNLVFSRIPDVAKGVTAGMTLDQMLRDRGSLASKIDEQLSSELKSVYGELVTVQVTDIAPDPSYMAKLNEKASAIADREVAQERAKTAVETLAQAKAETEIKLELARRENLVNQELAKVYQQNVNFYNLKRLELLREIIGPNDKLIFVPEGSTLSIIEGMNNKEVVPVTPAQ
jgi:regulator of protease activity HflC (stomatin/prohibitin superfamily)